MAAYTVTHRYTVDGYSVLQLLENAELEVGVSVTVAGVHAGYNGARTIYALPQYLYLGVDDDGDLVYDTRQPIPNQLLFATAHDDEARMAATGTVTYAPTCTWISTQELTNYLNITVASANDTTLIGQARDAANAFCFRRRQEAGYFDSPTTVPGADAKLGVLMYGAACYRSRGSTGDTFATFDGLGTPAVVAMPGMVKQLLGIDRPAVA